MSGMKGAVMWDSPGRVASLLNGWLRWLASISSGYGLLTSEGQRSYRGQFLNAKKHGATP